MHQKYQTNGILGSILLKNKIENLHNFEKYDWQKPHKSNQTGSK